MKFRFLFLAVLLLATWMRPWAHGAWPPPVPAQLVLHVRENAGVARTAELVRSGVPMPRVLNAKDPGRLALVDSSDTPVPAEFEVLARWNAGRSDAAAPIQWLLITFRTSVAANQDAAFRLILDGSVSNPLPSQTIQLTQTGNQIIVNTAAAIFTVNGDSHSLFDEVRLSNGTPLIQGGDLSARVNGASTSYAGLRRILVEHAGPLAAIVTVEGTYDLPAVGGGGLSIRRRYVFSAGSPTAIVRQTLNWEGDRCGAGVLECGGSPNAMRVQQLRDTLNLAFAPPLTLTAVGAFDTTVPGILNVGQSAGVRQKLRSSRDAPLAFDVNISGTLSVAGSKADGGILAVGNGTGAAAIAFNHMHRYEPQALRILPDNRLAVDLADDQVWIGARQGLFATFAVSALASNPTRAELERLTWAPLNRPLRAWPEAGWIAASNAVDEFPVGSLTGNLATYDNVVSTVLERTLQDVDLKGLPGLMTFGLYPRLWGLAIYSDELDCGGNDVTPGESWDELYWCTTWTDYHNTVATAAIWAMRTGQIQWLDEIAFPGALRMLHTQVFQCSPNDTYFYCGQAPAGYGGYRADFNSSHAYFDNLFLYYWLTGDSTVLEMLKSGASSMRNYLCSRRPAQACLPTDPPADFWAQLTGRAAAQWFAAFRFVGLAGDDAGYLEDYQSGLARAVTQHYVEAQQGSIRYGFWLPGDRSVGAPGAYTTDQLWMVSLYDMNNLYRLQQDTGDAPIGNPAIPPGQILAAWARTLNRFGSTVSGDGTAAGAWPNRLDFTWSGSRIGGELLSVSGNTGGSDPYLYDTGKATLTAALVRASQQIGDSALRQMGADLTQLSLSGAMANQSPLNKFQGEYLSRLHAAVARLAPNRIFVPLLYR